MSLKDTLKTQNKYRLLLFVGALIFSSIWLFQRGKTCFFTIHALEAVPYEAPFVLSVEDADQLASLSADSELAALISDDPFFQKGVATIAAADTFFSAFPIVSSSVFDGARKTAIVQQINKKEADLLWVLDDFPLKVDLSTLVRKNKSWRYHPSTIFGVSVFQLSRGHDLRFTIAQYENLLLISKYSFLVEDAIARMSKGKDTPFSDGLIDKYSLNDAHHVSVLINIEALPVWLSHYTKQPVLQWLHDTRKWLSLQLDLEGEELVVEGKGHHLRDHLKVFFPQKNKSSISSIASVVPADAAMLYELNWSELTLKYLADNHPEFKRYCSPWLGHQAGLVVMAPFSKALNEEQAIIIKTTNEASAIHHLEKWAEVKGAKEKDFYQLFPVFKINASNLISFEGQNHPFQFDHFYATVLGDYAIFCPSKRAVEQWINQYIVGHTLANDINYLKQADDWATTPNGHLYLKLPIIADWIRRSLSPENKIALDQRIPLINGLGQLSIVAEGKEDHLSMNAQLEYGDHEIKGSGTRIAWKTRLNAPVKNSPVAVLNPITKAPELWVQDEKNEIYILDKGGDIRAYWPFDESIISTIHQVDYYNNGQLQYLFNTESGIYLLDQEGMPMSGFPISMRARATNGLCLVNFGKRDEFGFFIACENGNVYGYELDGRPISGWNPRAGMGLIRNPIQHQEHKGKDYLYAANEAGQLLVCKRDGSWRFAPMDLSLDIGSNIFIDKKKNSLIFAGQDVKGNTVFVNASGKKILLNPTGTEKDTKQFVYSNIEKGGHKELIYYADKVLKAYTIEKGKPKSLFDFQFESEQDSIFTVRSTGQANDWIGSLDTNKRLVHLINGKGEHLNLFPLASTTPFILTDLGGTQRDVLITGFEDEVYAYHLGVDIVNRELVSK